MPRAFAAWGALALLVWTVSARAQEPTPDAASLVRSVREAEAWIDQAESLWIRAEAVWERTPEGIARHREELKVERPGEDVDLDPSLRPRFDQEIEIAFDRRRILTRDRRAGEVEFLHIWDGTRFLERTTVEDSDERPIRASYALMPDLTRAGGDSRFGLFLLNLGSFRSAHHPFWWFSREMNESAARFYPSPEGFAYVGQADFDGTPCHLVCRWGDWTWLYVSIADGRLRGIKSGAQAHTKPDMDDRLLAFLRREGQNFADVEAMAAWFKSLTPEQTEALDRRLSAHLPELTEPIFEFGVSDNREVAPGCWMPMTQTTVIRFLDDQGRNVVDERRTIRIVDVRVNEPLPDALFHVAIEEGAQVHDGTHRPPLVYRHKAEFTPEQWREIVARAEERAGRDEAYEQAQRALIGQPAPAFPDGATWLNGEPLTWATLAGKRVVLDFWAEWCGPCRNGYPALAGVYKNREQNGLVIIGIHPPGSDMEAIRKVISDFSLDYPTCIDLPADDTGPRGGFGGRTFQALGVNRIPHAVLIDGRGRIVRTGDVNDILLEALRPEP